MKKIASPQDLQAELRSLRASVLHSTSPSRKVIAAALRSLAARVEGRVAATAVPEALINDMKAAVRMMERALKAKVHKKFETIMGLETRDAPYGELVVDFWGPKKKNRRSPIPQEPSGRYNVHLKMASEDTVDIEVRHMPWKKDRLDIMGGPTAKKKGVSVDDAADVAEQLLSQVIGK